MLIRVNYPSQKNEMAQMGAGQAMETQRMLCPNDQRDLSPQKQARSDFLHLLQRHEMLKHQYLVYM